MDQTPPTPPSTSSDVRTWCVLCHAAALLGLFFHFLGHILGPLIVWLMKRSDSPEIDAYGKESLNFQISMLIYDDIAAILCIVLIGVPILPLPICSCRSTREPQAVLESFRWIATRRSKPTTRPNSRNVFRTEASLPMS